MRTFGSYKNTKNSTVRRQEYAVREGTQWDIRFDTATININDYIESAKSRYADIIYLLVSGKEVGAHPRLIAPGQWVADHESEHVHVALVLRTKMNRNQVLQIFRPHKQAEEYCVPRNQKFTYLGWRLHHAKEETKVDAAIRILHEYGTLPMDEVTEKNVKEIERMLKKFPDDDTHGRYAPYIQKQKDSNARLAKLERLSKLLDEMPDWEEQLHALEQRALDALQ